VGLQNPDIYGYYTTLSNEHQIYNGSNKNKPKTFFALNVWCEQLDFVTIHYYFMLIMNGKNVVKYIFPI